MRRPRGSRFAQTATLDRRPRQLRVTGYKDNEKDECITHFTQFGEIADINFEEDGVTMVIEYRTRQQAERAENRGKLFKERNLVLVWHKAEESLDEDEADGLEAEDDLDPTPLEDNENEN